MRATVESTLRASAARSPSAATDRRWTRGSCGDCGRPCCGRMTSALAQRYSAGCVATITGTGTAALRYCGTAVRTHSRTQSRRMPCGDREALLPVRTWAQISIGGDVAREVLVKGSTLLPCLLHPPSQCSHCSHRSHRSQLRLHSTSPPIFPYVLSHAGSSRTHHIAKEPAQPVLVTGSFYTTIFSYPIPSRFLIPFHTQLDGRYRSVTVSPTPAPLPNTRPHAHAHREISSKSASFMATN